MLVTTDVRCALFFVSIALVWLSGCGGSQPASQPWAGPDKIEELKIKGVLPDGAQSWSAIEVPARPKDNAALLARGKELYAQACLACHGGDGKGNGIARTKYSLPTPPADLTNPKDSIKIRSTYDSPVGGGVPKDTDLFRNLTRGLPGTAMWSYRELPPDDRWALVAYIQSLNPAYESPSPNVAIPETIPAKDEGIKNLGLATYQGMCMACHGRDGLGGSSAGVDPATGRAYPGVAFAREGGALTLGGRDEKDLARTLLAGFHRKSVMRSFRPVFFDKQKPTPQEQELAERKLWSAVFHVQELMEAQKKK